MAEDIESAVARRRTFAIISHPDAGKTTLTEKLLLFGGAIQLAGEVKAKKDRIETRSDWMKIERERGISVVTSVMTFEYGDHVFNLLDTPGHEDFADDTYRTLTAVDSRGDGDRRRQGHRAAHAEAVRGLPAARHPDHHLRQQDGSREPRPVRDPRRDRDRSWRSTRRRSPGRSAGARPSAAPTISPKMRCARATRKTSAPRSTGRIPTASPGLLPENERDAFIEELELAREACRPFDLEAFREGHLTPVYFGSALRNFGVRDLIEALGAFGPAPRDAGGRHAARSRRPRTEMSAFVFKIQANMDPNHRDRIAFVRVCSGKLERGMKAKLVRTGKPMQPVGAAILLRAHPRHRRRGLCRRRGRHPNHGTLRIGDTLTEGEDILFRGVPNFAPEILRRVRLGDAMKAKKLKEALHQMAEEGVVQLFSPEDGSPAIVGVVGALQLDVLKERLRAEYTLAGRFRDGALFGLPLDLGGRPAARCRASSRRIAATSPATSTTIRSFSPSTQFSLNYEAERWKAIRFAAVKDYQVRDKAA